jgi:hypothetical protein
VRPSRRTQDGLRRHRKSPRGYGRGS